MKKRECFKAGMMSSWNKHLTSAQWEKAANLADTFELLQLKPQEALQVKSYILALNRKQDQSCCMLQTVFYGLTAAQVLMAPRCLFPSPVQWTLRVQVRRSECCHLPWLHPFGGSTSVLRKNKLKVSLLSLVKKWCLRLPLQLSLSKRNSRTQQNS